MEIAIDLGTANILVSVPGKGVVLREPSVVAIDRTDGRVMAIGVEAQRMLGRTPGNILATRPLRDGVIADYEITAAMMAYFITKVVGKNRLRRPRVMVCVPPGATGAERRAVRDAAEAAGAGRVDIIEEPLAAALGIGIDITRPAGRMVVDVGGGTADVAVLSLGGTAVSESVRSGGDRMDEALIQEIKRTHSVMIGERTAEELKIRCGSVHPRGRHERADVRGRDLLSGLPRTVTVTPEEITECLMEPVGLIRDAVERVLEMTPPELSSDIMEDGIWLTGGGALLHGLDAYLAQETGVPVHVAEDPMSSVALGTARALEYPCNADHLVVLRPVL